MPKSPELVIEGHLSPSDAGRYHHVPFEMPPGTGRLDVRYDYSSAIGSDPHLTGGNTLDIGIFDARGIDFPGGGFRGWTGSSRREFFITPNTATPGYLPGPLLPGTWHICLGLYKSAPEGCDYRVTIQLSSDSTGNSAATFPPLLAVDARQPGLEARPDGWYRGELHCHSHHSDGDSPPVDLIAEAQRLGLDFLAVTDHNNISHLADLAGQKPPNLILIPGFEGTTYKGHWNVWGAQEWIDFRNPTPERLEAWIAYAVQHGCVTSCNHPRPYGPPWEFEGVRGYHCVEVWNGPWKLFNWVSLAFWEARVRAGEHLVMVGGSDAHFLRKEHVAHVGTPTTWIHCPGRPTAAGLLAGLRAGHVFLSDAPDGPQLYLSSGSTMMGDTLMYPAESDVAVQVQAIDGAGLLLELHGTEGCLHRQFIETSEQSFEIELHALSTPYIRAQLVEPDTDPLVVRALTNPLYLTAIRLQ
jgi:hypothetical protein